MAAIKDKVIMVYPALSPTGQGHRGAPLSSLAVGSHLAANGFKVKVVDLRVDPLSELEFGDDVAYMGISAMTGYQIHSALEVCRIYREKAPGIPLVWGGWHASLLPEETMRHPLVDIVVTGQGEITALELARALRDGASLDAVKGIFHKRGGEIVKNPDQPLVGMDVIAPIDYGLINMEDHFIYDPTTGVKMISYLASRGCPYRCGFCAITTVYNKRFFNTPVPQVLDELGHLVNRYGVNGIYFEDDNLFINKQRTADVLQGMVDRGMKVRWTGLARADRIIKFEPELMKLMRDSGCIRILIGAESGSQAMLDLMDKDVDLEETIRSAEMLDEYGIEGDLSFMVGLPDAHEAEITLDFIMMMRRRLKRMHIKLFFYTPYPGGRLYDIAKERGFVPPDNLEDWARFELHKVTTPWVSPELEQKVNLFRFYFRHGYPNRAVKGLKSALSAMSRWRLDHKCFSVPLEYNLYHALGKV